jgi:hypothetical protein
MTTQLENKRAKRMAHRWDIGLIELGLAVIAIAFIFLVVLLR